jgi:hypothetical protein
VEGRRQKAGDKEVRCIQVLESKEGCNEEVRQRRAAAQLA